MEFIGLVEVGIEGWEQSKMCLRFKAWLVLSTQIRKLERGTVFGVKISSVLAWPILGVTRTVRRLAHVSPDFREWPEQEKQVW